MGLTNLSWVVTLTQWVCLICQTGLAILIAYMIRRNILCLGGHYSISHLVDIRNGRIVFVRKWKSWRTSSKSEFMGNLFKRQHSIKEQPLALFWSYVIFLFHNKSIMQKVLLTLDDKGVILLKYGDILRSQVNEWNQTSTKVLAGGISLTRQRVLRKGVVYIVKCSSCGTYNPSPCWIPQKGVF